MTNYSTQPITQLNHNEEPAFSALQLIDVNRFASTVQDIYKNSVLCNVNDHCIRVAVMQGEFRWHKHDASDETFLVLEGLLEIDFENSRTIRIRPCEAFTIPAGIVHRTRAAQRTVNLCFERRDAYVGTTFVDGPSGS
jgi:mannose-6-phosphate isomerase-like protein (cupin superfamily)